MFPPGYPPCSLWAGASDSTSAARVSSASCRRCWSSGRSATFRRSPPAHRCHRGCARRHRRSGSAERHDHGVAEAPFIAVVAVTLAVLDRISRGCGPRRAEIPAALVLCATATMLRITGVALLVPLAITLFTVRPDRGRRQRALLTLGAITACMLPLALWTVGNRVGTGSWAGDRPGSRTDLAGAISSFVATLRDWVAPESITAIVVVAVIVVTAVVLLADTTPGRPSQHVHLQLNTVVPWVVLMPYVGFQLVASSPPARRPGARLLAPVWPALVVTGRWCGHLARTGGSPRRLADRRAFELMRRRPRRSSDVVPTAGRTQLQVESSQLLRQVSCCPGRPAGVGPTRGHRRVH